MIINNNILKLFYRIVYLFFIKIFFAFMKNNLTQKHHNKNQSLNLPNNTPELLKIEISFLLRN